MITIKKFDSNLLKSTKNHINPLYLTIAHASGYIERSSAEEKGVNKYLVFNSTDEMKIKSYLKNTMFLMELETKSKK